MVYESDFYTVRRPYSRPTITSYSVTVPRYGISTWKVKPSIRQSVLIGELDRIYHRPRPHLGYAPLEDYLNSRPLVEFDDETRLIRAETDRLMRRIYTSVPHPRHSTPLNIIPYHGSYSGSYSGRRPTPVKNHTMVDDILSMSYYSEPSAKTIGRGHLACVTYAGGRGYPRRKHLFSDEYRDIGDEIKTRSYYNNSYNKAYVDAMSLPTGFASYLLRIKPPENNESLTSLDKMHLIALSEERKKNQKKDKTSDAILNKSTEIPTPLLSKTNNKINENINQMLNDDKVHEPYIPEEKVPISEDQTKEIDETPINKDILTEEISVKKSVESSKPDKKSKKKNSISKIQPAPESPIQMPDVNNEHQSETTHEPQTIPLKSQVNDVETDKTQFNEPQENIPEPQETEPINPIEEVAPESYSCEIAKEDPLLDNNNIQSEKAAEQEPLTEFVAKQEDLVVESMVGDSQLQDNSLNECIQEVAETTPTEHTKYEEEEEKEIQVSQTLDMENQIEEVNTSQVDETLITTEESQQTAVDEQVVLQETNVGGPDNDESPQTSVHTEKPLDNGENEAEEVPIPTLKDEIVEASTLSPSDIPDTTLEYNENITSEVSKTESTNEIIEGNKDEINALRPSESNENVIEEVIDSGTNEFHKENETEPLIEEPQSPSDNPEITTEKSSSNVICEVLSDVAEE